MLLNTSQHTIALLHQLQNDISQVQNSFLKWKLVITNLPNALQISHSEYEKEIVSKLESIKTKNWQFNQSIEEHLRIITQKMEAIRNQFKMSRTENTGWSNDEKYLIVTEKIATLQESLRRTQQNQRKLIDTLNAFLQKYQIKQQPSFIKSDQYLKSKLPTLSQASLITFQPCVGSSHSLKRQNSSQKIVSPPFRKQQSSIYLLQDADIYSNNTTSSHSRTSQQQNFIRTFSKPGNQKISLKQTSNQIKFPSYNMEKIRQATKEDRSPGRPTSLDRNQHRFKFMIDHLNS